MRRKDEYGRILKKGETQLEDGSYEFRITVGERRYSICCPSLDELRLEETALIDSKNTGKVCLSMMKTVNDAYYEWLKRKVNLKGNTMINYRYSYEYYVKNSGIGRMLLKDVKRADIKKFYNRLADQRRLKASTIDSIHTVLHQVFDIAVDEGVIMNNPSDKAIYELRRSHCYDGEKRKALTREEQQLLLDFIQGHDIYSRWYNVIYILLNTGMRIGEACGLTWDDIDFDKELIYINRTLVYYSKGGTSTYSISTPKTEAGKRVIPMFCDVKEVLLELKLYQEDNELQCSSIVDGISGFILMNRECRVLNFSSINKAIKRIIRDCNDEILLKEELTEDTVLLPMFSCHSLRHSFATNMVESGVDIKTCQSILGHCDISTTYNIYVDVTKAMLDKSVQEYNAMLTKCN